MSFVELFLIAVGLSMDAFAVSICKGLGAKRLSARQALLVGLYFGGFQALMPLIGWLLGCRFEVLIRSVDHWIAFLLLLVIGGNMIKESFGKAEELNDDFGVKTMLLMAIATSIDALAVGITFAFLEVQILPAAGQGILAVQTRLGMDTACLAMVRSDSAACCALAERAFVRTLNGGCTSPVAAYAVTEGTQLTLTGLYVSPDETVVRKGHITGPSADAEALGQALAEQLQNGK